MSQRLLRPKERARPHVRLLLTYVVVLLLGMAMAAGSAAGARQSGIVTMLVGVGGCVWELAQWARAVQTRHRALEQAQMRRELNTARRARRAQEQEQTRQQRQTQRRAMQQRAESEQAARQARAEQKAQAQAQRAARFEAVAAQASRLQSLSDAQLSDELPALFALRGLRVQGFPSSSHAHAAPSTDATNLRLLRLDDESVEVASHLPQGRTATVADVEALEQWRQSENARHAYLLSRNGFSAQAVRLAARYPLTLVEPQLLAQWQLQDQPSPSDEPTDELILE